MRRLPRLIIGTLTVMALGLLAVEGADATSINFSNIAGASVQFLGGSSDSFRMLNSDSSDTGAGGTTRDFSIDGIIGGGFASLVNLLGNITGTFTIGAITTVGPIQTAPVSGAGTFSIDDGAGESFTAALDWVSIQTVQVGSGPSSGLVNASGTVNLGFFSYAGGNADLLTLAGINAGTVIANFSFNPGRNLTALTALGANNSASYAGGLSVVPEPTTMFLGGTGLVALAFAARRRLFGR